MKIEDKVDLLGCWETEWYGLYLDGKLLYQSDGDYLNIETAISIFTDLGCQVKVWSLSRENYNALQEKQDPPYPNYFKDLKGLITS